MDDGPGLKEDISKISFKDINYDMEYYLGWKNYFDKRRIERIKLVRDFQTYKAFINKDSFLSLSHDLQDKTAKVAKGAQVTVEYSDSENEMAKVRLSDGKVGWMDESCMGKSNPTPLFPVLQNANSWTMVGGNPGRSYFTHEKPIHNPAILQKIPYFQADEPLVVDLDGDERPEIIANDLKNNLNVIRGDGNGVLFKVKDLNIHGIPTFMNEFLFVIGERSKDGKWMVALGKDGVKRWEVRIGRDNNGLIPEGPYVLENKVYSQRLIDGGGAAFQCFDLWTGKELWAYSYNHSGDYRPLFENNISVFTVQHNFAERDKIVVYNLNSQKVLWEMDKPANALLVSNGRIVFHDYKNIQVYRLIDGKFVWSEKNIEALGNQPNVNMACDGKSLFVFDAISNTVYLKSFNLATGKRNWLKTFEKDYSVWPIGRMALVDGALYYSKGTALVALNSKTGDKMWELPLPGGTGFGYTFRSSVIPAAGHILVAVGNVMYLVGQK